MLITPFWRNCFKLDSKNLDYQQEINRKKADTETMRITRELDIKSSDHSEENRRKLIAFKFISFVYCVKFN